MRGVVAIYHLKFLVRSQSDHVRGVFAALLFEGNRLGRNVEGTAGEAIGNEHDDVAQRVVTTGDKVLAHGWCRMKLRAARISVHAELGGLRSLARKLHLADHGCTGSGRRRIRGARRSVRGKNADATSHENR